MKRPEVLTVAPAAATTITKRGSKMPQKDCRLTALTDFITGYYVLGLKAKVQKIYKLLLY
jgi:hypothetical protein